MRKNEEKTKKSHDGAGNHSNYAIVVNHDC